MTYKPLIPIAAVGVFLFSVIADVTFTEFDPTPFTHEINKLGAIEKSLNSI